MSSPQPTNPSGVIKDSVVTGLLAEGGNFALQQGANWLGRSIVLGPTLVTGVTTGGLVVVFELARKALEILKSVVSKKPFTIVSDPVKQGLSALGSDKWGDYAITGLTLLGAGAAVFYLAPLAGVSLTALQVAGFAATSFAVNNYLTKPVEDYFKI